MRAGSSTNNLLPHHSFEAIIVSILFNEPKFQTFAMDIAARVEAIKDLPNNL